jgi:beta-lactamase superfamily II metal-dependent hydrolase
MREPAGARGPRERPFDPKPPGRRRRARRAAADGCRRSEVMAAKKSSKKSAKKSSKAAKAAAKAGTKAAGKAAGEGTAGGAAEATEKALHLINVDLARVWDRPGEGKKFVTVLGWGDEVIVRNADEVEAGTASHVEIMTTRFIAQSIGAEVGEPTRGYIVPKKGQDIRKTVVRKKDSRILKVDFVDVQQGDGSVIITPNNHVIVVDGGSNQMFARYLANRLNRFEQTSADRPREIDCILVTHGDADHFAGLVKIFESETLERLPENKRVFIYPKRVFHNGLVKRPGKLPLKPGEKEARDRPEIEMLGRTEEVFDPKTGGKFDVVVELVESLIDDNEVTEREMNKEFKAWRKALKAYDRRCDEQTGRHIEFRRLELGMDKAFDFVNRDEDGNPVEDEEQKLRVEVLGPLPTRSGDVKGLKFLGSPPKGPRVGDEVLETGEDVFKGVSASHTINGHSVILRLTYGGFSFLLTGDLNDEAGRRLADEHQRGRIDLNAEVFKVPHHGSGDFSGAFLQAVSPLISVVSSGDESARVEYIHPRATIMGALGKFGRGHEPLVFVTELVAFFEVVGPTRPEWHRWDDKDVFAPDPSGGLLLLPKQKRGRSFFAFRRTAYGLVRVRTDGKRLLVYTNSGQARLKEAYAYTVGRDGEPVPDDVMQV